MADRAAKPVTVTLGPLTERANAMVSSGRYASLSEVMRAGVRALDREEQALARWIDARLELDTADASPTMSAAECDDRVARHVAAHRATRGG